jgi:ferredoxin
MDNVAHLEQQRLFFATGRRHGTGVDAIEDLQLRPAVLAPYRDLAGLRYDFPLVLVDAGPAAGAIRSLSSIVDEVLREVAPRGIEGERLRKAALRLERGIREMAAAGAQGTLAELWSAAVARVATPQDGSLREVLADVGKRIDLDGRVVDCDAALPAAFVTHAWRATQAEKARAFRALVDRLAVKLSDILRAAYMHSQEGQRPESLRASLGGAHRDAFDFAAMSRLLERNMPQDELPAARRRRIESALEVLRRQSFYPDPRTSGRPDAPLSYEFRFGDCAAAAAAYRERLPKLAQVVKAIAVAELEADGQYVEARDDPVFAHYDEAALSAEDIALFPDYLVCIPAGANDAPQNAGLMDMLSAGLPVKVLVEIDDLLEEASVGTGHFAFGVRSARLGNTATGLGGVFVVQTASANLYALRERVAKAFAHRGAGLLTVYAGAGDAALPAYLMSAAAMESRAFPAFTYDPHAGDNQAARFALEDNPQPEADWPVGPLVYADADLQRIVQEMPFTVADFVLCDRRYAAHFARVPKDGWHDAMVPADEWLALDPKQGAGKLPYVLAADPDDVLQRVIVDARLMQTVARSRTFWHRLQEQGGIHNSHADILLAREKAKWEAARAKDVEAAAVAAQAAASAAAALQGAAAPTGAPPAAATAAVTAPAAADTAAAVEAAPARNPDEAWIETARCPSCNECQNINDRMFKYNDNKQAYIADINAGTYRQLVEAAEVCQVSIIHPGKPRNPGEPGLAELLERAKPFL